LQDRFWQESGGKALVLRDKEGLTRPSLQDSDYLGAFGHGSSAGADCELRTGDSSPGISDSNPGFVPSSIGGFPAGSCGSPGRFSTSRSASAVSENAGTLACCNSGGSLCGDWEQKAVGSLDWRIGSSGSWFLPPGGKTMTLLRRPTLGKNKNQIRRRWLINLRGQRKNIQAWDFLTDQP
jgi:hypothetical protein